MAEYNFLDLSPFDFELLAKEIAEKKYKRDFEAFDVGRDGGIDIRSKKNGTLYIGQCKHYAKSTFAQLKSSLKNEIVKVKKLNPSKYIVFTSLRLSPQNKDDLVKELAELKLKEEDIWGSAAINSFIQKNPEIEKHHIKLWLKSTAVLESVIFKGIAIRSKFYKEDMLKKAMFWSENSYLRKANNFLDRNHFCIITGIPGIGKTTLAEMICLNYLKEKFVFVKISSLEEFFNYYNPKEKQIFFYDDFLGETKFKDDKNFDDLKSILKHLNSSCKFIFTSREYIFNQAKNNEKFSALDLDNNILSINEYSEFEKARILYNHLFYGKIKKELCDYIVKNKKYWEIIHHGNYSPRIIDFMCSGNYLENDMSDSDYFERFMNNLEHPAYVWDHAFNNSVETKGKYILYSLFFLGNKVDIDALQKISYFWIKLQEVALLESSYSLEFKRLLAELENSFIRIDFDKENQFISFNNPSITDYFENQMSYQSALVKEFNSLPCIYWDQKEVVLDYLPIEQQKEIIIHMYSSLKLKRIPRMYMNESFSDLENKNFILSRIIREKKFQTLEMEVLKNFLKVIFEQKELEISLISNLLYQYEYSSLSLCQKIKLCNYFFTRKDIPTLTKMLQIDEKIKFLNDKKVKKYLKKTFSKNTDISLDRLSYYELENYRECYSYLIKQENMIFVKCLDDVDNRLEKIYIHLEDEIEDARFDAEIEEELENRRTEEIDTMFSSLSE